MEGKKERRKPRREVKEGSPGRIETQGNEVARKQGTKSMLHCNAMHLPRSISAVLLSLLQVSCE